MPKDDQKFSASIEDLLTHSEVKSSTDENAQVKLAHKEADIKRKEVESSIKQESVKIGIPYFNLIGFPIGPEVLSLIPEDESKRLKLICFYYDGKSMRIGAIEPKSSEAQNLLQQLIKKYHCGGSIYMISKYSLEYGLKLYKSLPKRREIDRGLNIKEEDLNKYSESFSSFKNLQEQIDKSGITDVVTMIMAVAIQSNASDIHVEGEETDIKIRLRIDGILHDAAVLKKDAWNKLISRMKGLAGVKINISDKPQDGRISIYLKDERIDIRVSFLPTAYGESIVMRLLRSSSAGLSFKDLGIRGKAFDQLKHQVERPNGMIMTTGPTGSGKTTTLYAILKKLNNSETKIITVEDPIEYQLKGVNQSQIGKNYTFAKGLRSIVRQDPDVIMIGEIRDLETSEIAIQAALTGHLVLSTLHTNDAAGAIPRFLSMGVKSFLLAPAINVIIGQRLVRRICAKCKKEIVIDDEQMEKIKNIIASLPEDEKNKINIEKTKFYAGDGCEACQGLGYKGRVGIYEIMVMNRSTEKLILSDSVSEYDMRDIAIKNGMITIVQDGLFKAIEGITTVKEVFRVAEQK